MKVKLFDSERKVMEVLWQGGELPAKDIARALADSVGWNKTPPIPYSKSASKRVLLCAKIPVFAAVPASHARKFSDRRRTSWSTSCSTALRPLWSPLCWVTVRSFPMRKSNACAV